MSIHKLSSQTAKEMASCDRVFVKAEGFGENNSEKGTVAIPVADKQQTVGNLIEQLLEKLSINDKQPDKYELRLTNGDALLLETSYVHEVVKNDELLTISMLQVSLHAIKITGWICHNGTIPITGILVYRTLYPFHGVIMIY